MKSGLEGRNNVLRDRVMDEFGHGLNEVRPRRPEQSHFGDNHYVKCITSLNEVRPRRPEQFWNG